MAVGIFVDSLLGLITDVEVDAKFTEEHGATATPATFALENGAVVSDHIILNPITLAITYELNNQDFSGYAYGIRAATLFNILRLNMNKRQLYTVVTRHRLYLNMAIIDLPATHAAPFTGTLTGTVKFQQINEPSLQSVEIPTSQLAQDGTQFKASSAIPGGKQVLADVDSTPSALAQQDATWGDTT